MKAAAPEMAPAHAAKASAGPDLTVLLAGSPGRFSDRAAARLAESGVVVKDARRKTWASPVVWDPACDVIVLVKDPQGDLASLDMLRRWRKTGLHTPVLAVAGAREVARCLDGGADDCVTDAVAPAELRARLRALARRAGGKATTLRVADLTIDTRLKTVERAGQPIALTRREYDLLEFLARYHGRIVSRQMIWERLYGAIDGRSSNVVDVYIRYLRNKIDKGFDRPLIRTRWGLGYMLAGDEQAA